MLPTLYRLRATFLAVLTFVFAAQVGRAAPISAAMRKDDPRLEIRVSVSGQGIYLGDLIERLSEQSGVALSASDLYNSSGERVFIGVHDLHLADVLNSLWSLFSYRGASWTITRTGTGKAGSAYHYDMQPSFYQRQWAAGLRDEIQHDLEAQAEGIIAGLKGDGSPRPDAPQDDIVSLGLSDESIRAGMSAFASLPEEQRDQLLHGVAPVGVTPTDSASSVAKALSTFVDIYNRNAPSPVSGDKIPKSLLFTRLRQPGEVTPYLSLQMAGLGGPGILGGDPLEKRWQTKIGALWINDGDSRTSPLDAQVVPEPVPAPTARAIANEAALVKKLPSPEVTAHRVEQASNADSVSFIVRLPWLAPGVGESTPGTVYGKPLSALFDRLNDLHYRHKWRDGILLVSRFDWIYPDAGNAQMVSYSTVKRMQSYYANPRPPLEDLVYVASAFTAEQLETMRLEYRQLDWVVFRRQLLLDLSKGSDGLLAALRQKEGVPLSDLPPRLVQDLKINRTYDGAVRLEESEGRQANSNDGRIFHFYSFFGLPAADTSGRKPELRAVIPVALPESDNTPSVPK